MTKPQPPVIDEEGIAIAKEGVYWRWILAGGIAFVAALVYLSLS